MGRQQPSVDDRNDPRQDGYLRERTLEPLPHPALVGAALGGLAVVHEALHQWLLRLGRLRQQPNGAIDIHPIGLTADLDERSWNDWRVRLAHEERSKTVRLRQCLAIEPPVRLVAEKRQLLEADADRSGVDGVLTKDLGIMAKANRRPSRCARSLVPEWLQNPTPRERRRETMRVSMSHHFEALRERAHRAEADAAKGRSDVHVRMVIVEGGTIRERREDGLDEAPS